MTHKYVPQLHDVADAAGNPRVHSTGGENSISQLVSDCYDSEWGSNYNAEEIRMALSALYAVVSGILGRKAPLHALDLVRAELPRPITVTFTEKEWGLIQFALERAGASL